MKCKAFLLIIAYFILPQNSFASEYELFEKIPRDLAKYISLRTPQESFMEAAKMRFTVLAAGRDAFTQEDADRIKQNGMNDFRAVATKNVLIADWNNDGEVSLEEAKKFLDSKGKSFESLSYKDRLERIMKYDLNGDEIVSRSEMLSINGFEKSIFNTFADEYFLLDANQDKTLTRKEYTDGIASIFNSLDSNKDGVLDTTETQLYFVWLKTKLKNAED